MGDRANNAGTPVETSVVARVAQGVRYIVSGVTPNAWFGPAQPLQPVAQEQAAGRRFDFPTGVNTRFTPRQTEQVPFWMLRALADNCDILRTVIETRKDQLEGYDWEIVPKDGKPENPALCAQVVDFLLQPTPEYDWSQWLRMLLEDLFVLDAVAVYPRFTRDGSPYALELLDAATIMRVVDDSGRTPLAPSPAYQQVLHGVPAADYSTDDLVYIVRNPRTHKMYGYGPVEQVITIVNVAIRRTVSQLQYFTEGNIPEALAALPDAWNLDQIREFQVYWDTMMEGNTAQRRHMKFVPFDATKIKEIRTGDSLKDSFDEWIARVVCFAFSIPPTPFVKETNRAQSEQLSKQAKQEGLLPWMKFLKRRIDNLLHRMGVEGVEFRWKLDETVDLLVQAQVDQIYIECEVVTADEVRTDRFDRQPMTPEERAAAFPVPPPPVAAAPGAPRNGAANPQPGESPEAFQQKYFKIDIAQPKIVVAPNINLGDTNVTVPMPDVHVTVDDGDA
jgi:hypothetical protein